MNDPVLKEIIEFASEKMKNSYGYCALSEAENKARLEASDCNGNEILIELNVKPD